MIIQFASDLHLEFPKNRDFIKANPLRPKGEILLLAGDIVPFTLLEKHQDFFNYLSDNFETTYWIPGNHEYYYFDLGTKSGVLNESIRNNVHLVNNISMVHHDVKFIFSTLWSKISPAHQWEIERSISDFQVISFNMHRFSAEQFTLLHEESIKFIIPELQQKANKKTVVITHHVPTFLNYPEKYKGDVMNEAFAVELFDLIEKTYPNYWIYGHHHTNTPDFVIGQTKMLTNQLGYVSYNEHQMFSTERIFKI